MFVPFVIVVLALSNKHHIEIIDNFFSYERFRSNKIDFFNKKPENANNPYYFGKWCYLTEDNQYREYWLNDSLLVIPSEDSLQIMEQDVIDDIIYFTEIKGSDRLRIFFAKPEYINDSVQMLTGDIFSDMHIKAFKIENDFKEFEDNMEIELFEEYKTRKNRYR